MSKYFQEVGKQFVGDKSLAVRYMGIARSLLGGLKEMSAGLYQNARHVLLPDGTRITVGFFGDIARVMIDVRGVSNPDLFEYLFMESGAVWLTHENLATYATSPADAWLSYGTDITSVLSGQIQPKLLGDVAFHDGNWHEKYIGTTPHKSLTYTTTKNADDVYLDSDIRYAARVLLKNLSGANFTGLMRLFISSWLGSRPNDIIGFPSILSTTRSLSLVSKDEIRAITENTGIYRYEIIDDNDVRHERYWMVDISSGGTINYWEVTFGPRAQSLMGQYQNTDGVERYRMLAYLFTDAVFGEVKTASIEARTWTPLAWGWKFNSTGSKADIILCRSAATTNQSVHWQVEITWQPDPDRLEFVLTKDAESAEFVLGPNQCLFAPNALGIQELSDFGRSEDFPASHGYNPIPNTYEHIPIYCFYGTDDILHTVLISGDSVTGGYSETTTGPADISLQHLDSSTVPLKTETVIQWPFVELTARIVVNGVLNYTGTGKVGNKAIASIEYDGAPNGETRYWPGAMTSGYCPGTTLESWDAVMTNRTAAFFSSAYSTTCAIPLMDAEAIYVGRRLLQEAFTDARSRLGEKIEMSYVNGCGERHPYGGFVYQYTFDDALPELYDEVVDPPVMDAFVLVSNRGVKWIVDGTYPSMDYFYSFDPGTEERALISWGGAGESYAYYGLVDGSFETVVDGGYTQPAGTAFVNFIGWD